jgi:hypothetical protein
MKGNGGEAAISLPPALPNANTVVEPVETSILNKF